MSLECPWCRVTLDKKYVGNLTKASQPCPSCGNPIRESVWQVLFTVLLLLPVIAGFLYLSYSLGERGHKLSAVIVFLCGGSIAVLIQAYFPQRYGPAKGN